MALDASHENPGPPKSLPPLDNVMGYMGVDCITGFQGYVVGQTALISGCCKLLIQPEGLREDGTWQDAAWIDAPRVELSKAVCIQFPEAVMQHAQRTGPGTPYP